MTKLPSLENLEVLVDAPPVLTQEELVERLHQELRADSPRREREADEELDWGDEVDCDLVLEVDGQVLPGAVCRYRGLELRSILALPGFVEALVGARVPASLSFPLTLSADYPAPALAGREVRAHVLLHAAWEVDMPELDEPEALAEADLGDTVEEAMSTIRELAENERQEDLAWEIRRCLLDVFGQRVSFEVSEAVLDAELQARWETADAPVLRALGFSEAKLRSAAQRYVADKELRDELTRQFCQLAGLNALIEEKAIRPIRESAGKLLSSVADYLGLTRAEIRSAVNSDRTTTEAVARHLYHLAAVEHLLDLAQVQVLDL